MALEDEVFQEYQKGASQRSLAEKYQTTVWFIRKILTKKKRSLVREVSGGLSPKDISRIQVFKAAGRPNSAIAKIYGVHKETLRRFCKRNQISSEGEGGVKLLVEDKERISELRNFGKTLVEIAALYGVRKDSLSRFCRRHGVGEKRNQGPTQEEKEKIIRLYLLGFSLLSISEEVRSTSITIKKFLEEEGMYDPGRECLSKIDGKISCRYQLGESIEQIAEGLGLPSEIVRQRIDSSNTCAVEGLSLNRKEMRGQEFLFRKFCEWAEEVLKEGLLKVERWVGIEELSSYFGIREETLEKLTKNGEIPYQMFKGYQRFRISEVTQALQDKNSK